MNGRRCPRFEYACRTVEGAEVWDAVQRAGAWTGGGMTPRRIDRNGVRARLDHVPAWILEVLLDAFEPAALKAAGIAEKNRAKRDKPEPRARRAHDDEDAADD